MAKHFWQKCRKTALLAKVPQNRTFGKSAAKPTSTPSWAYAAGRMHHNVYILVVRPAASALPPPPCRLRPAASALPPPPCRLRPAASALPHLPCRIRPAASALPHPPHLPCRLCPAASALPHPLCRIRPAALPPPPWC